MTTQLINWMTALCSECEEPTEPEFFCGAFDYEGPNGTQTHNPGDEWLSACCSAVINDECGGEWTPDFGDFQFADKRREL